MMPAGDACGIRAEVLIPRHCWLNPSILMDFPKASKPGWQPAADIKKHLIIEVLGWVKI